MDADRTECARKVEAVHEGTIRLPRHEIVRVWDDGRVEVPAYDSNRTRAEGLVEFLNRINNRGYHYEVREALPPSSQAVPR